MWILILFAYDTDSVSITTQEVSSQQACIAAGQAAEQLARGSTKVIKYACVRK